MAQNVKMIRYTMRMMPRESSGNLPVVHETRFVFRGFSAGSSNGGSRVGLSGLR
jgi:hypothetical protein